jgi:hypothetical protein
VLTVLSLVLLTSPGFGQITGGTQGIAPFGSYTSDPTGEVNAGNLNVHSVIPVRTANGLSASLLRDNNIWQVNKSPKSWIQNTNWGGAWDTLNLFTTMGNSIGISIGSFCNPANDFAIQPIYTDQNGYTHNFTTSAGQPVVVDDEGCKYPESATGTDPYGWTMSATTSMTLSEVFITVTDPSGNVFNTPNKTSVTYTDSNGNQLTQDENPFIGFTGNPVVTSGADWTYYYNDQSGTQRQVQLTMTPYIVQTNFGCSGIAEYPATGQELPTTIKMPDESTYQITYELTPNHPGSTTGRIATIKLPTGGLVTYNYNGPNHGISCQDGGTSGFTRTTSDGTWTYSRSFISSPGQWKTVITAPSGQTVTYLFTAGTSGTGAEFEVSRTYAESGGGIIQTIVTCYNGNVTMSTCAGQSSVSTVVPTEITAFRQLPNSSGRVSEIDTKFTSIGLPTTVKKYDFGSGVAGGLLETTTTAYGSYNGAGCSVLGNNILTKPCSVQVVDGPSGYTKALTYYSYDQTAPVSLAGTVQHVSVTGSRGNLEKVQRATGRSTVLTTTATHYDTGAIQTFTDVGGARTTYNYSSSSTTCGNRLPDSVSLPSSQTESFSWDCNGGVLTSGVDVNGHGVSETNGDEFWRLTSQTDELGITTTVSYTPTSIESVLPITSGASADSLLTVDAFGRPAIRQVRQQPAPYANFDTLSSSYDGNGRPYSLSLPCSNTISMVCPASTISQTYDAANRPLVFTDATGGTGTLSYAQNDVLSVLGPAPAGENAKQTQAQYDGLGRTQYICHHCCPNSRAKYWPTPRLSSRVRAESPDRLDWIPTKKANSTIGDSAQ